MHQTLKVWELENRAPAAHPQPATLMESGRCTWRRTWMAGRARFLRSMDTHGEGVGPGELATVLALPSPAIAHCVAAHFPMLSGWSSPATLAATFTSSALKNRNRGSDRSPTEYRPETASLGDAEPRCQRHCWWLRHYLSARSPGSDQSERATCILIYINIVLLSDLLSALPHSQP